MIASPIPAPRPRPRAGRGGVRPWLRCALPALAAALLLTACGGGAATPGGATTASSPRAQMEFGVQMARQGLWSEALFRFRQAVRLAPEDPRLLNNLAVAYEATGRYDDALEVYQKALQLAPESRELRRNYARFVEFYQSYRPQPEAVAEEDGGVGGSAGSPPSALDR